ncbi:hypothetical protein DLAC_06633 [Tieghemostelium lacteum]|uniref:Glutathione S-transferase n=1 Tax=Tieghemostelium lacteum TaxID=361077 RepID=A0A151ZFD0_TIELA|nr:hypothetical protein DLAC_06633 [Tieghemostelium lacteum]|eukprot:KYQ92637.1 hypothetical protein DLAC_06633 [Tieghemostelium lacteum]
MSQPLELIYFDIRGKAQLARNILTLFKIPFVDTRIKGNTPDDALKQLAPYKQFPIIKIGDLILAQSMTIARFYASQNNYSGKTFIEKALADEVVDSTQDLLLAFFTNKDDEEKRKNYFEVTVPSFLSTWESKLVSGNGFIARGDSYTFADLSIFTVIEQLKLQERLVSFPNILKLFNYFVNHEILGPYYKSLPADPQ